MDSKIKILVAGDVRGRYKQLFQRVDGINKKAGPFEILLCVGDFFGKGQFDDLKEYKTGQKQIAVPTYILGPVTKEQQPLYQTKCDDGEICENLTYLGKRGLYTLSSGVKIAYLSGIESLDAKDTGEECYFTKADIAAIRNSCLVNKTSSSDYKGVDILLTSQWPFGINAAENQNASKLISFLCREIKPRYHFCGFNGKHHEPTPFRMPSDTVTQLELCTRFVALAEVGNSTKAKYIYALSINPVEKMRVLELIQKTTNELKSPFAGLDLSECTLQGETSESKQYFYDMHARSGEKRNKRPRIMNIDQDKCWFCLSSPDVEKHMVISIGDNFYLALAKGPINIYHILILSITHIPCSALLSEDDWRELTKFKSVLRAFFKEQGQVVCFTERNYKSSHLQLNVLGIDDGYAWKLQHAFEDKAEEFNLEFEMLPTLESPQMLPKQGPYFVAELPNETTLITRQMKHFPLHFARDVFCSENLLNCDEKVDWKACKVDKNEEVAMVQNFRKQFSKYDFTL